MFQAERDGILAAAIRLMESSATQAELFAAVESEARKDVRAQVSGEPEGLR
jgi:hypothetical protein